MTIHDKNAKYLVYYFDKDTISELEDEGIEDIFDERLFYTVTQYGELVYATDDEDDALSRTSDYIRSSYDACAVWNVEEKYWFN